MADGMKRIAIIIFLMLCISVFIAQSSQAVEVNAPKESAQIAGGNGEILVAYFSLRGSIRKAIDPIRENVAGVKDKLIFMIIKYRMSIFRHGFISEFTGIVGFDKVADLSKY